MGLISDFSHDENENFDGQRSIVEHICERYTKWLGNHGYAITPKQKVRTNAEATFADLPPGYPHKGGSR
jgi:hypothetical protein